LVEFANGGAQATVKLKDGRVFFKALVSNATAVIAVRGYKEPPFAASEIDELYQSEEDKRPNERFDWEYWDDWSQ